MQNEERRMEKEEGETVGRAGPSHSALSILHSTFERRVVYGEQQTHLTQNQAALDVQVVSRRPFSISE